MYQRKQIFEGRANESAFLWGARQTGKSTLLRQLYPDAIYFDLLLGNEYEQFQRNTSLLREILETVDPARLVIFLRIHSQAVFFLPFRKNQNAG